MGTIRHRHRDDVRFSVSNLCLARQTVYSPTIDRPRTVIEIATLTQVCTVDSLLEQQSLALRHVQYMLDHLVAATSSRQATKYIFNPRLRIFYFLR